MFLTLISVDKDLRYIGWQQIFWSRELLFGVSTVIGLLSRLLLAFLELNAI